MTHTDYVTHSAWVIKESFFPNLMFLDNLHNVFIVQCMFLTNTLKSFYKSAFMSTIEGAHRVQIIHESLQFSENRLKSDFSENRLEPEFSENRRTYEEQTNLGIVFNRRTPHESMFKILQERPMNFIDKSLHRSVVSSQNNRFIIIGQLTFWLRVNSSKIQIFPERFQQIIKIPLK